MQIFLVAKTPEVILYIILIPVWISNNIHYKVWDEIIYPLPNFNDADVEVWEQISDFISLFTGHVIIYQCWG